MNTHQQRINFIPVIHKLFCNLTRNQYPLTMGKMLAWEQWLVDFKEADLRTVIQYMRDKNRKGQGYELTFRKLIDDRELFSDRLVEAQAAIRGKWRQPILDACKESVLAASGRPPTDTTNKVKPVSEIVPTEEEMKAFAAKCKAQEEATKAFFARERAKAGLDPRQI